MERVSESNGQVQLTKENLQFNTNIIKKEMEIVIEKPVIRRIEVEKPYEVIIQKPVERILEKEIIIENYIDNPVQKIIETEVEEIIE